ncbi:hypothetical protein Bpfe_014723 [Biomphalaria pfeifferi]|uniref:Uncharacterized protein n=1 Tax=Biomphalaria pfeifferi TaxID=112525 RepID=A0AAD8BLD5_BIOPF|nr:hypothetical protein Bpfe_014723 [Biomphalaria pfeifferi]
MFFIVLVHGCLIAKFVYLVTGDPIVFVRTSGKCENNIYEATIEVDMNNENTDKWPLRLLVEEKQDSRYLQFCQVSYIQGVCVPDMACNCTRNESLVYFFSLKTTKRKQAVSFRAVLLDAAQINRVERNFTMGGEPHFSAMLDNTIDLSQVKLWKLQLYDWTDHNLTLCLENTAHSLLGIEIFDIEIAKVSTKCFNYTFKVNTNFALYKLKYWNECQQTGTVQVYITALDPDNITAPDCSKCVPPGYVNWLTVVKWLSPTTILSAVSIFLMIFYLQTPKQPGVRNADKSSTSMRSATKTQSLRTVKSSNKSLDKIQNSLAAKSSQNAANAKSATSQNVTQSKSAPTVYSLRISFDGTQIM